MENLLSGVQRFSKVEYRGLYISVGYVVMILAQLSVIFVPIRATSAKQQAYSNNCYSWTTVHRPVRLSTK